MESSTNLISVDAQPIVDSQSNSALSAPPLITSDYGEKLEAFVEASPLDTPVGILYPEFSPLLRKRKRPRKLSSGSSTYSQGGKQPHVEDVSSESDEMPLEDEVLVLPQTLPSAEDIPAPSAPLIIKSHSSSATDFSFLDFVTPMPSKPFPSYARIFWENPFHAPLVSPMVQFSRDSSIHRCIVTPVISTATRNPTLPVSLTAMTLAIPAPDADAEKHDASPMEIVLESLPMESHATIVPGWDNKLIPSVVTTSPLPSLDVILSEATVTSPTSYEDCLHIHRLGKYRFWKLTLDHEKLLCSEGIENKYEAVVHQFLYLAENNILPVPPSFLSSRLQYNPSFGEKALWIQDIFIKDLQAHHLEVLLSLYKIDQHFRWKSLLNFESGKFDEGVPNDYEQLALHLLYWASEDLLAFE